MRVVFARDYSIASFTIRLFTWSRWHHCGVVTKDGQHVIEASALKGVIKTPIDEFKSRYRVVKFTKIPVRNNDSEKFLHDQLGKKYDWLAIISMVLRLGLNRDNKWFCSELVATASGMFRGGRSSRVTPEHLWMISEDAKL